MQLRACKDQNFKGGAMKKPLYAIVFLFSFLAATPVMAESDAYAVYGDDATYIYDYYNAGYYDDEPAAILYNPDDDWFYDYYYTREDVEEVEYDYDWIEDEYEWEVEYDWF